MTRILLDLSPAGIQDRIKRFDMQPHEVGQLRTPLTQYALSGHVYGLDNGCFSQFPQARWETLLKEAVTARPLWAAMPDIVGSARRTLELFEHFAPRSLELPLALVLQDGIGDVTIPWNRIRAVFVGGSDAFKTSPEAFAAAKAARMLGKAVHVGRVNTAARMRDWLGIADSIDGSGISRYDHMLGDVLALIRGAYPQLALELTEAAA